MSEADANRHAVLSTLVQASRKWRKLAQQALAAHDISQARAAALVWVHRLGGGVRQIVLASYVGIEGTSLVRLLDELSAAGLLIRRDDLGDRRAKTIWLTPDGETLARRVENVLADLRDGVLSEIDPSDIDATLRVFRAIDLAMEVGAAGSIHLGETRAPQKAR
ncbi:MarR family winged helix-turn-helix transcriptional regulator [Lichenihabitans psoromatis]|uniref:MarR family winged helix-turn-helix transcriptional regulator n=1 Tax=Lichenihabitans psoromatis TaxID=2528642 RepID=UPI001035726B|nr:MarR family transcriptional regulator [Lichenihabitans psoromatis]